MPLKHKVHLSWPIISLSIYLQTSHAEMLLKHCERQCWQSSFQNIPFTHISKAPCGPWLGTSLYTSPTSSSQTLHCNEVVVLEGFKVAPGVEGTPRVCRSQETVLHQIWGVYANVIHHVNVLNGLVLSLDEGRTAGTCLNGTLFRGLWAGGGKKIGQVTARYRPTRPWWCF